MAAHAHHVLRYIILRPVHGRARFRIAKEPTKIWTRGVGWTCDGVKVLSVERTALDIVGRGNFTGSDYQGLLPPGAYLGREGPAL